MLPLPHFSSHSFLGQCLITEDQDTLIDQLRTQRERSWVLNIKCTINYDLRVLKRLELWFLSSKQLLATTAYKTQSESF